MRETSGCYGTSFIAFVQDAHGNIKPVRISLHEFDTKFQKEINEIVDLKTKDEIINGLKTPRTIILNEDYYGYNPEQMHYLNLTNEKKIDRLNLKTEFEYIDDQEEEITRMREIWNTIDSFAGGQTPCGEREPLKYQDLNIDLFKGGMFRNHNRAIQFIGDTQVKLSMFEATMLGLNKYKVQVESANYNIGKVLPNPPTRGMIQS